MAGVIKRRSGQDALFAHMVPTVNKKLKANGEVSDSETKQALRLVLDALAKAIKA